MLMTSNDAGITSGEVFDFDQWIESNKFSKIKPLMMKHNLNTIDSLSLTSPQYTQFLCDSDLLQTKSNFIPKIHKAIQVIQSLHGDDFIVISEAEKCVIDTLKQHIVELDKIDKNIKELKAKYPQSIQRINKERDVQIEEAHNKITDTFKNIKHELSKREKHLLNELTKMKEGDINVDDVKEIEVFQEVQNRVKRERNKMNLNLKSCDQTIRTYKNKQLGKRKDFVLKTGQESDKHFNSQMKNVRENEEKIQELISKHTKYSIKIAYNVNESKYNDLLLKIRNLGAIESSEQRQQPLKAAKDQMLKPKQRKCRTASNQSNVKNQDNVKEHWKEKYNELKKSHAQTTEKLHDTVKQWQRKYDKSNALNLDKTDKWKILQQKHSKLLESNRSVSKQWKLLQQKCNNLTGSVEKWQQKYETLTAMSITCNKSHDKTVNDLNNLETSNREQINETKKWQQKYIAENKKSMKQSAENKKNYDMIVKSLTFGRLSGLRWCTEEKEQHIPAKKFGKQKKFISLKGALKNNNEVFCSMGNMITASEIGRCVCVMRKCYEESVADLDWTFDLADCWDDNLKGSYIVIDADIIKTSCKLYNFRSAFGATICDQSFKYYWKLKQEAVGGDFYIGIEEIGRELKDTYFCKSNTSYGFSGYYAKLYSNDTWGGQYGKYCCGVGDVIGVCLDLRSNELSFDINGEKYGKAYDVAPDRGYKLAVSMRGKTQMKMVSSTKSA